MHNVVKPWEHSFTHVQLVKRGGPRKEINFAGITTEMRCNTGGSYFRQTMNSRCPNCCDNVTPRFCYYISTIPYSVVQDFWKYKIGFTIRQRNFRNNLQNSQRIVDAIDVSNIAGLLSPMALVIAEVGTDIVEGTLLLTEVLDEMLHGEFDITNTILNIKSSNELIRQDADKIVSPLWQEEIVEECVPCPSYLR